MTAFLRSPKKVPENIRSRIHVIVGDVLNADQVSDAIEGKHAVISCLGVPVNFGRHFHKVFINAKPPRTQ